MFLFLFLTLSPSLFEALLHWRGKSCLCGPWFCVYSLHWDLRTQKSNTIRTIVAYNLLRIQFHKTYVHKSAVSCADTGQLAVGFKGAQKSNTFRTIAI